MTHSTLEAQAPLRHPVDLAVGFNWFEHLGAGGHYARWERYPLSTPVYPDMADRAGWEAIREGLDTLNPGWIRFGLPPDPHVRADGSFHGETVHMERLAWLDAWAAKAGATLLLDPFVMPAYFEFPVPPGTRNPGTAIINMAAEDNVAYAERFVVPLLEHVLNTMGLTQVRYFNPINEPMEYGVYQTPGDTPPAMTHYVSMMQAIRTALDAAGITRDRIGLLGLDTIEPLHHLLDQHRLGVDLDPYVDAYSVHHYNLRFDHQPPLHLPDTGRHYFIKGMNVVLEQDDRLVLEYARLRGKPLWALEMGTFYYGKFSNPAGVASLPATMIVAEGIIRAINMGITAFCLWSLMNSNDVDGHWAVMGHQNGQLVRHGYPFAVYGLLSEAIRPRATVTPLMDASGNEILHVHGTMLTDTDGTRHVIVINDNDTDARVVTLRLPDASREDSLWHGQMVTSGVYNESMEPVFSRDGALSLTVPPLTLVSLRA